MSTKTAIFRLEEEERQARIRLASFRARLYRRTAASPMATDIRLRELEHIWKNAADRLQRARKSAG